MMECIERQLVKHIIWLELLFFIAAAVTTSCRWLLGMKRTYIECASWAAAEEERALSLPALMSLLRPVQNLWNALEAFLSAVKSMSKLSSFG